MEYVDFFRERLGGKNWVIARCSVSVVERYGDDVICVSKARYEAVEREWRELYGRGTER